MPNLKNSAVNTKSILIHFVISQSASQQHPSEVYVSSEVAKPYPPRRERNGKSERDTKRSISL